MRRILTWSSALCVIVAALTFALTMSAQAATTCQVTDPLTGSCTLWVTSGHHTGGGASSAPNPGGPKNSGSGHLCFWDGTSANGKHYPPSPVRCSSPYGYWSNAHMCYLHAVSPQPAASSPAWQGHSPGDGAVYNCYQPQTGVLVVIWEANPPPKPGGPTPAQLAQSAVRQMRLSAITIGTAPEPGPNNIGLVGMPVWMWTAAPNVHTVGPVTATASAGGITITATARLADVTWDMGDGTTVICHTAGTPYKAKFGQKASPDCGHTYTRSSAGQPGQAYVVSATSHWVVTWAGGGQTGTIRLGGLTRSTQIRIGEAQVLVN